MATTDELRLAAGGADEERVEEFGCHHPSNAAAAAVFGSYFNAACDASAEIAEAIRCEANISKGISLQGWPPPAMVDPVVRHACVEASEKAKASEQAAQCHLLQEIFHGPRRAVFLRSQWRTATVLNLASAIYGEPVFDRMTVLADALEAAGCDEADVLGHCRQPGLHVRGCWVDLLLGKG